MSIEYIYKVFKTRRISSTVIGLLLAKSKMYTLTFSDQEGCSKYLRVLHNLNQEMQDQSLSTLNQIMMVEDFIEDNPFLYDYQIQRIK